MHFGENRGEFVFAEVFNSSFWRVDYPITPQKPIKRAYEQSPAAVQAWLEGEYPGIEQRARAEGAEIHWGDETALVNTDVRGRSYAPTGKTPVTMAIGGTRQKLSMIATVTNQGKTRWMIIDEAFDADKLIEFLQALIKDAGKKVFLILDNLRVHHSKLVKAWVAEHQDQIELFYLPSYSPQLNPEERLNADLKPMLRPSHLSRRRLYLSPFLPPALGWRSTRLHPDSSRRSR
jgi:transposase